MSKQPNSSIQTTTPRRSFKHQTPDSSLNSDAFTPIYDDSNWSDVVCSKADQYAKLIAARKTNAHYKRRIEQLKQKIIDLNEKGENTLSVLESIKEDLMNQNDYLSDEFNSNPPIDFMEKQLEVLQKIKNMNTINIVDEQPFHEIGILTDDDNITKLPKKLQKLLRILASRQKSDIPLISSLDSSFNAKNLSMKEAILRRRYKVLKQTTEGSIKKAIAERENLKNEILALKEKLQNEKSYISFNSYRRTMTISTE